MFQFVVCYTARFSWIIMFRIGIVALLLLSLALTSGQDTGIGLGTCTYSFVVQSPYCGKDVGGDAEADIQRLHGTVAKLEGTVDKLSDTNDELKNQLTTMAREISEIKTQLQSSGATAPAAGSAMDGQTYVIDGCQNNNAGVFHYLMIAPDQSDSNVITVNLTVNGIRLLLDPFPVFCTGNNYIVFQRRRSPFELSFNHTWAEYKAGFGDVTGEFWLGLDRLYHITNNPYVRYTLRMEFITKHDGYRYYIEYDNFYIGNDTELFRVKSLGRVIDDNTAGGWMDGNPTFRTWDRDTDRKYGLKYNGFWYCDRFTPQPFNSVAKWGDNPISWTEFKIRPVQK